MKLLFKMNEGMYFKGKRMGEIPGHWLLAGLQQLGITADLSAIRAASEINALQYQMLY